jgi:ubiquitin carboxyl-terminal hydrolase 1
VLGYYGFYALDFNLLPLQDLLWNCLVYATPPSLLSALDEEFKQRASDPDLKNIPQTHAAKSVVMRRLMGLDKAGAIINNVAQAGRRRLSTLPGIGINKQGEDGRPPGLGNYDNSCYQNSVLQGLASLDTLPAYLLDPRRSIGENTEALETADMKMSGSLRGLITTLKEIAKAASTTEVQQGLEPLDVNKKWTQVPIGEKDVPVGVQIIRNPLEGLLAQRVGCTKCGYSEGLSMIPFNCLTVPLGRAWTYDISQCLDEYTKLEPIDGVECGKCTLLKLQRLLTTLLERTKDVQGDNKMRETSIARLELVTDALESDDFEDKTLYVFHFFKY